MKANLLLQMHEPASTDQSIEQGDLPDWVKAMAPQQPAEAPAEEEELPDWINKIGASALPPSSESSDQPDWINQLEQPAAQPVDDQPDWLKQLDTSEQPASSEEQPDWLKGFGNETESTPSAAPTGELDWLSELGETSESKTIEASSNESDFLKELGTDCRKLPLPHRPANWMAKELGETSESKTIKASSDEPDFLKELGTLPETPSAAPATDEFDFLNELAAETEQLAPSPSPEPSMVDNLGMSSEEQDDSFAWLENLAAKQGATEGLLTKPEERLEEEPDWVKQAKGMDLSQPTRRTTSCDTACWKFGRTW